MEQLNFDRRKEAFGHGIIEAVADGASGGQNARVLELLPEGQRRVLAAVVGVVDEPGGRVTSPAAGRRVRIAMPTALSTSSVRRWSAIAQPTTFRLKASSTTAR
jgi:hypothetical protein